MDSIFGFFQGLPFWGQIVSGVLITNIALTAVYEILVIVAPKTSTGIDDKAVSFLGKILGYLKNLVSALSANTKNK